MPKALKVCTAFVTALIVVGAVLAPTAASAAPLPYEYEGRACDYYYFQVPADASRVRPHVPNRFAMVGEAAGTVVLWVAVTSCQLSVNGTPAKTTVLSDVGVVIETPAPVEGFGADFYLLWQVVTEARLVERNRSYGIPTGFVPDTTFSNPDGLVVSPSANVPWDEGAYTMSSTNLGQAHPALDGSLRYWHVGSTGLVLYDQFVSNETDIHGAGQITADPAGRLGALVGGAVTGTSPLATLDISFRASVVEGA